MHNSLLAHGLEPSRLLCTGIYCTEWSVLEFKCSKEDSAWLSVLQLRPCPGILQLREGSVQLSLVTQMCLTLCDSMDYSTPGLPVHHQLPKFTQTDVHWVSGAIQPSHPLSFPSPPAFNLSQHQGLFKWVSSSHQVANVLEFQLQHHFFQWIFGTDFL